MLRRNSCFSFGLALVCSAGAWAQTGYDPAGGYQAPGYGYQNNAYAGPNQGYQYQNQADGEDQPGRPVARISILNGDVSVRRADAGDVVAGAINAPLLVQDALTTGPGGRAEVQLDYAHRARLGPDAEMRIAGMEPNRFQLQLSRGFLTYSVVRDSPAQAEISTPVAAVRPLGRSQVRVWVREDGETTVTARYGEVEVFTPRGTERLRRGQSILLRGNPQDPEYQIIAAQGADQWDYWNDQRDRDVQRSVAYNYVNQDVVGAEDLDTYGRWDTDPQYGRVWVPQVASSWAPYTDGRWAWEDYYGWTWVSAEPWGWAPYHYGNWYRSSFGWAWYPGERYHHTWYRPALVGFFGFGSDEGVGFGLGFGNVGWCALAPHEVYHPWYRRGGFGGGWGDHEGFGRNLTIVNNTNITNIYSNARYGAVAANAQQFMNGGTRYSRVGDAQLRNATFVRGQLPLAPTANTLRYSDRQAAVMPRTNFANSRFYSRSPVNQQLAARIPFQQQQQVVQQSARSLAQTGGTRNFTGQTGQFGGLGQNSGFVRQNGQAIYRGGAAQAPNGQTYGQNNNGMRFGNLPNASPVPQAQPPAYRNNAQYQRGNAPQQNTNWSRFGQPNGAVNGSYNGQSAPFNRGNVPSGFAQPQAQPPGNGWNRFGSASPQQPPVNRGQYSPSTGTNQGYVRGPQYSAPGRTDSYDAQRSLQLSQPVVRPREAPAYQRPVIPTQSLPAYRQAPPAYSAPSYRQPAYSAPSAPAYRQQPAAPAYRNHSEPAQAYRPAPQAYSAPNYRQPAYSAPSAPAYRAPAAPAYQNYSAPAPGYRQPPQQAAPAYRQPQAAPAYRAAPSNNVPRSEPARSAPPQRPANDHRR